MVRLAFLGEESEISARINEMRAQLGIAEKVFFLSFSLSFSFPFLFPFPFPFPFPLFSFSSFPLHSSPPQKTKGKEII